MNIFYKRPLALILCITVGGFAVFSLFEGISKLAALIISLCLLLIGLRIKYLRGEWVTVAVAASLIVSIISSFLYFDIWFQADKRYTETVNIDATVEEFTPINSYTAKIIFGLTDAADAWIMVLDMQKSWQRVGNNIRVRHSKFTDKGFPGIFAL